MKIPEPIKLPSGNWRIQLRIDGQSISITEDDEDVCIAKAMAYKTGLLKAKKQPEDITVGKALERYIKNRENVTSPSTIRGYKTIKDNRFQDLQGKKISSLNKSIVQCAVNAEKCSPKTLQNSYSLIMSAIVEAGGEIYKVKLPMVPRAEKKFLQPEEIEKFLKIIQGTDIEIPCLLGLWSCRRSEIIGLEWKNVDLENRIIHIREAKVMNENNKLVQKNIPKNKSSERDIPIVDQLYNALSIVEEKTDQVVKIHPNTLYTRINKLCKENGFPEIGVHGLRHSFASLAYHLHLPEKETMKIGGWETDEVMQRIYTHLSESDKKSYKNVMTEYFNAHGNAHENGGSSNTNG